MNSYSVTARPLAYVDSFAGLVPCKLTGAYVVDEYDSARIASVEVTYTATRGAYKKGETHWHNARYVVPRPCIMPRRFKTLILPFAWR